MIFLETDGGDLLKSVAELTSSRKGFFEERGLEGGDKLPLLKLSKPE